MLASKGKRYDAAAREDIADGKKALAKKSAAEIAARSDLKEKDFYFLGRIYAAADNDAKVLESMQKFLAQFPSDAYPTTMLLDRNGVVRYIGIGSGTEESENLEDMIKKVISEDGRLAAPQK
ncbi:MAG: hypothetical protein ABIU09_13435 [Pyrinomonadaceae bacterium]